jgi:hypothetical protein
LVDVQNNNSIYLFIYVPTQQSNSQLQTQKKWQGDNKQANKIKMAVTQNEKIKTI